ncbi:Maf family protein [Paracoccus albus]|uniref:Maf family protein n=1 Tax=Paracoccus albus TaxID=3017784 RepID=UPI0022F0D0AA|nr:Maf family protein [Paracoccus albus]WBU60643.1 Maf family protein [Paracoccus albus]
MNSNRPRLVLGSASPRRLELLGQIGFAPDEVRPADIDETPLRGEAARDYVRRMATEKCAAVTAARGESVLTADTVVVAGRRILGKPVDRDEARSFLALLAGRRHRVMTAVALKYDSQYWQRLVETTVKLRPLENSEIEAYLRSDEWQGKAGGYGIQGRAGAFVSWMSGSFSAVVGLPLSETATLLRMIGLTPSERA